MIDPQLVRHIRNDLPMPAAIVALGQKGPPSKLSEGHFRFFCSASGELKAAVNPRNNLADCFCCQRNLNNIDLMMSVGYDFRAAVEILAVWLGQHEARQAKLPSNPTNRK